MATGDDSASRMLFSHGVLDADTEVFQLSQFPDDLTMEGCSRMISLLRLAIERGKKIFMMYTEPIHGSFYDLFNQFFTVRRDMQDQQEVVSLYVNIAIGPYSRPCRVHPKTQILVHTPARSGSIMSSQLQQLYIFEMAYRTQLTALIAAGTTQFSAYYAILHTLHLHV